VRLGVLLKLSPQHLVLSPEWHLLKPITVVIPAQAGIQNSHWWVVSWIPACAGMTKNADLCL